MIRIPNKGAVAKLEQELAPDHHYRLFTNDVAQGLTEAQIAELDESDFTEATFPGYAPVLTEAADWTVVEGPPAEATADTADFECTSDTTPQTIRGYYVTEDTTGDPIRWWEYFEGPVVVEHEFDMVRVRRDFTGKDKVQATAE